MNALAKRAPGTGTVSYHRATGKWRYRLPGSRSIERGGFATAGEAAATLDAHRSGFEPRFIELRRRVRQVLDLAAELGVNLEHEIKAARAKQLAEWARARRQEARTR